MDTEQPLRLDQEIRVSGVGRGWIAFIDNNDRVTIEFHDAEPITIPLDHLSSPLYTTI
jgi:hypothetical protein